MKKPMKTLALLILISCLSTESVGAFTLREDPYENAYDDTHIKVYYLRRIANDVQAGDPEFRFEKDERLLRRLDIGNSIGSHEIGPARVIGSWEKVEPSTGVSVTCPWPGCGTAPNTQQQYGQYYYHKNTDPEADTSKHPEGDVYLTQDSSQLEALFEKVAQKIKTRLVK